MRVAPSESAAMPETSTSTAVRGERGVQGGMVSGSTATTAARPSVAAAIPAIRPPPPAATTTVSSSPPVCSSRSRPSVPWPAHTSAGRRRGEQRTGLSGVLDRQLTAQSTTASCAPAKRGTTSGCRRRFPRLFRSREVGLIGGRDEYVGGGGVVEFGRLLARADPDPPVGVAHRQGRVRPEPGAAQPGQQRCI